MSNLDTQCKCFSIVLNIPNGKTDIDVIGFTDWCDRNTFLFAMIKHDKDTNHKGLAKTIHYHIVLKCASRYRISTILYRIADLFGYYSTDELSTIHVQKCDSLPNAIQYLTHKNCKENYKYHYNYDEIISNFNDDDLLDLYNTKVDNEITVKTLTNYIKQGYTDFQILATIGLGRYNLYKGAINDIRYALQHTPNSVNQFLTSIESVNKND